MPTNSSCHAPARIQLEPPKPFHFRTPDDWPRWKKRFELFRQASGLSTDVPVKQVNTLLYCIGEEAETVLTSTNTTDVERENYDIIEKFDSHFKVRKNVIFERAVFNRRSQLEGETADQYIMELYRLAESCHYIDAIKIRDRLVVGIRDVALSQQLQLDAELTLDKAIKKIQQKEAVAEQQNVLKGGAAGDMGEVHGRQCFPKRQKKTGKTQST